MSEHAAPYGVAFPSKWAADRNAFRGRHKRERRQYELVHVLDEHRALSVYQRRQVSSKLLRSGQQQPGRPHSDTAQICLEQSKGMKSSVKVMVKSTTRVFLNPVFLWFFAAAWALITALLTSPVRTCQTQG